MRHPKGTKESDSGMIGLKVQDYEIVMCCVMDSRVRLKSTMIDQIKKHNKAPFLFITTSGFGVREDFPGPNPTTVELRRMKSRSLSPQADN